MRSPREAARDEGSSRGKGDRQRIQWPQSQTAGRNVAVPVDLGGW
jgi:hypothetical protein